MTLGTIGSTHYPETEGTYTKVCQSPNGWPIYQKENSSEILHFISDNDTYSFWYFTEKASTNSPPKLLMPVSEAGQCPGPDTDSNWFVHVVRFIT